jgi:hypothetical protein
MKTRIYTLLVLFVGCASWASAKEPGYAVNRKVTKKASRAISGGTLNSEGFHFQREKNDLKKRFNGYAGVIIGDNHFRTKSRSHGQVWLGPLGGDGVFLGPLGGDGVFSTILDRMATGQLSKVGKLDEDFNIVLAPGDLSSMQEQALEAGDIEVLGILIMLSRKVRLVNCVMRGTLKNSVVE